MSLKNALLSSHDIEIENDILTISEIGGEYQSIISYQCFVSDIKLTHPQAGAGRIIDFRNNKWLCDFIFASHLYEVRTKELINYIN